MFLRDMFECVPNNDVIKGSLVDREFVFEHTVGPEHNGDTYFNWYVQTQDEMSDETNPLLLKRILHYSVSGLFPDASKNQDGIPDRNRRCHDSDRFDSD